MRRRMWLSIAKRFLSEFKAKHQQRRRATPKRRISLKTALPAEALPVTWPPRKGGCLSHSDEQIGNRNTDSERWLSGRKRSPAKGVRANTPSRVRIPLSPPLKKKRPQRGLFFLSDAESWRFNPLFDSGSGEAASEHGARQAPRESRFRSTSNRNSPTKGPFLF